MLELSPRPHLELVPLCFSHVLGLLGFGLRFSQSQLLPSNEPSSAADNPAPLDARAPVSADDAALEPRRNPLRIASGFGLDSGFYRSLE